MLTIQNYVKAESLEQAYELNQKRSSRILGGMLWLRQGRDHRIGTAIDLTGLGLNTIEETEEIFSIGCMTTLHQLETDERLNRFFGGAVRDAVRSIVGVQFRNLATVGGSIWGRFGFSDVLTLFLALDAEVELFHAGRVPLTSFARMPYDRDLLVRVLLPKKAVQVKYLSVRNTRTDFPVLACAVARTEQEWRVSAGARPGRALVYRNDSLPARLSEEQAAELGRKAAASIPTGTNLRGSAAYRSHLIQVLTRRGCIEMGGEGHED